MKEVLVFAVILLLLAGATLAMRRKKARRLGPRENLTDSQLLLMFPSAVATESDVLDFLASVASAVEVPKGLLRPDDRFSRELATERGWEFDDELSFLPSILASKCGGTEEDYDLLANDTLTQLFRAVERSGWGAPVPGQRNDDDNCDGDYAARGTKRGLK